MKHTAKTCALMVLLTCLGFSNMCMAAETTTSTTTATLKIPFTLDLFKTVYAGSDPNKLDLTDLEPSAGTPVDPVAQLAAKQEKQKNADGNILLDLTEETDVNDVKKYKFEIAYSPVEDVKIKAKSGGLMLYKKIEFHPTPVRASLGETDPAFAPPNARELATEPDVK